MSTRRVPPPRGGSEEASGRLGTFAGVFTPSILTILGIILFLRLGYVVGSGGLGRALAIIAIANGISVLTSISLAAIATNLRVRGGGDYYLISRTLGMAYGGALGIVLFLAQSVSIAFYALGFGEAVAAMVQAPHPWLPQAIAAGAVAVLFVLAWLGADLATRFQFVVMAVLFAALASFFVGSAARWDSATFAESWLPGSDLPFWTIFAIFFPAVTGFTQGVSMSGDLKDPGKSLPLGTFLAVGLSALIYFAVAILLAGAAPTGVLVQNFDVMRRVSSLTWLIDAGVMAATLSSALASFLGAPRILQSLAADRIFPILGLFAAGHGPSSNPRRGVVLAGAIAFGTLSLGNLNLIAPIVSMFFLISYGLLNSATYFEARGKSPSFRPRFRWFDQRLSLLGGAACLAAMVALNPTAGAVALAILYGIYHYVRSRAREERWADSSRSNRFQEVREHLHDISEEIEHPRDWRPVLLAFSDNPARRERILRFASWIEGGSGLTTAVQFIEGDGLLGRRKRVEAEQALRADIARRKIEAFPMVVAGRDVDTAIPVVLQAHGLGPIRANTVLLNWYDRKPGTPDQPGLESYGHYLRVALGQGCNLVILEATVEELERFDDTPLNQRRIDVWYEDSATGRLMLIFAYLMTRTLEWSQASIQLCLEAGPEETAEEAVARARAMLESVRIDAKIQVVSELSLRSMADVSATASIAFVPFRLRGYEVLGPLGEPPDPLLEVLCLTSMVLAAQDLDLDADPEEGIYGEIASTVDARERARLVADNAEHEAARMRETIEKLSAEVEKARAEGADSARVDALEGKRREAEVEMARAMRRGARAVARATAAEQELAALKEEAAGPTPVRPSRTAGAADTTPAG